MKTRLAVALFLAAAVPAFALAAEPAPPAVSALERLDLALAEGRLDRAEHALLGFRLLKAPKTMPAEFRPSATETPLRCGTLLARRAFVMNQEGLFDADQAAQFAALGGRPDMPNKQAVMNGNGTVQIATLHATNAVPVGTRNAVAAFLTESWDAEFGAMGWRPPPVDGGSGGTGPNPGPEYDFYLDPNEFGGYTQPTIDGPEAWFDAASFIVLQSDVPNIETYVAHELNHASQFAYDYTDGDFIYEATATWMEDKVYDSVNDYTFFITDFQHAPSETLSFATYSNSYMYGGAVFFHYLSDVYDGGGTTVVRDVWDNSKIGSQDWFDGVEAALNGEGFSGIADVYTEFAGFRLLTEGRGDGSFDEENNLDSVSIEATYVSISDVESGTTSDPPMGMGANYIVVNTFGADAGESLDFSISSSEPGPWAITAVAMPASGSAQITVFNDEDDDGQVEATVPNAGSFSQVGFAITNTSNANQGVDSSQGGITRTPHDFSWSFGGGSGDDPVGCGCHIPAGRRSPSMASVIGAFLLACGAIVARRRSA